MSQMILLIFIFYKKEYIFKTEKEISKCDL